MGDDGALAPNLAARLRQICRDAAGELSASGVGLSVLAVNGVHGMAAASDPATERIEELQFTFGEGPCVDAHAASRPLLIPDLAEVAMGRWPVYGPAAHEAGIRAVFAFPLQFGATRLGVLDVFRTTIGGLTQSELGQALLFADRAVTALLDIQESATPERDGLDEALDHHAALFQAQGMVMVQLRVSLAEAMVRMRAMAYADNRHLNDIAADIVARRLRFDRDQP
ncbi:MAG: GAF and ANTAR domain-containing protein [Actinoplanes sp.]